MSYYQVILKLRGSGATPQQIMVDASERELLSKIVKPFKKGNNLFHDSTVFDSNNIEMIKIIRTDERNEVVRDKIYNASVKRIDKLNRQSDSLVIISPGDGYDPEDILEAGDDVTEKYIVGPPGYGRSGALQEFIYNPWVMAVGTGLIIAAVVAWRNWN